MLKIGLLSDTHTCFDDKLKQFFENVDEIWHAGDIGSLALADAIQQYKPLRAVHGNIDGADTRLVYPEILSFNAEEMKICMTHITGYPGKYTPLARKLLTSGPQILIGGHSHILRVMYDKSHSCLHINPGAAGISGFHTIRTAIRFVIEGDKVKEMEVGEWDRAH